VIPDAQVGALPAGVAMKTRETYRGGQLYIALAVAVAVAVVGRPPFIQKDR
jgi:hypothetical protein